MAKKVSSPSDINTDLIHFAAQVRNRRYTLQSKTRTSSTSHDVQPFKVLEWPCLWIPVVKNEFEVVFEVTDE